MSSPFTRPITTCLSLIACAFLISSCEDESSSGGKDEQDVIEENMMILKKYAIATLNAPTDSEGKFPTNLETFRKEELIPADFQLIHPTSGEKVDPIYHSGFGKKSPGETILFATPFLYSDETRGYSNVFGQALRVKDEEYQEKISSQK